MVEKSGLIQWKLTAVDLNSGQIADQLTYDPIKLTLKGVEWLKNEGLNGYQTLLLKDRTLEGYLSHLSPDGGWSLRRDLISIPR